MSNGILPALAGYAIGTAQILILDWFRARWAHARQLRLLRAELRRIAVFKAKFGLRLDRPPERDQLPRPASMLPAFLSTVSAMDFWITDEHRDDNSQEGFLGAADGFAALGETHARAMKELDAIRSTDAPALKKEHLERLVAFGADYDEKVDYMQYLVSESLRDIDRRLKTVRWWRQLLRLATPMPRGSNPPPLQPKDPRVAAWLAQSGKGDA